MKKITIILCVFISLSMNAQLGDVDPDLNLNGSNSNNLLLGTNATEFLYDIGTAIGAQGNAGVVYLNNEFWVASWNSANIHVLNSTGGFVETFTIAGLSGVRSFTTDGTNIYAGANNANIYVINPTTRTVTSTIPVTSTVGNIRFVTYDANLNSGSGGFWIGNFNTDIVAVSTTGTVLNTILAATHGLTGMYGAAVNSATNTLYVYAQMAPSNDIISSISLPSGTPTGLLYDVFATDLSSGGTTTSLAGGTFLSTDVVSGETVLIGVSQATPSNMLWGINVTNLLSNDSFDDNNFKIYPNPVKSTITFSSSDFDEFSIYSISGQKISSYASNLIHNNNFDVSHLSAGVYFIFVRKADKVNNYKIVKE